MLGFGGGVVFRCEDASGTWKSVEHRRRSRLNHLPSMVAFQLRCNVTARDQQGFQGDPGNCRPIDLTFVVGPEVGLQSSDLWWCNYIGQLGSPAEPKLISFASVASVIYARRPTSKWRARNSQGTSRKRYFRSILTGVTGSHTIN